MIKTHISQKMIISAVAGLIIIPGSALRASAAEEAEEQPFVQAAGIESVLEQCYETDVKSNINLYLVPTEEGEYLNMAFSDTGDFTYIRSAPDENSGWVGKLYGDSAAQVLEYLDGWTKIRSGSAEGYVPADTLITGAEAEARAEEYETNTVTVTADVLNVRDGQGTQSDILTQVTQGGQYEVTGDPVNGWYPIKVGETDGWVSGSYVTEETSYSYGETKEEEEQRIAEENAQKEQSSQNMPEGGGTQGEASQTSAAGTSLSGQAVIDYACQFIGNPYVWGGTSLTDGADCSGFVQSVYAHFGISLPRTTYDMVNSGYAVSYEEAAPGDLILYDGHVGLYMGDGNIVNAMNEADGIGICSATYANIIAVRRVL
ncbi:NlpC/P60 family protein [Ruminococcus sp. CLA-AA-H200]|uniref:NlpC/P60 family protein n=1 Tax=Ruminococcus turbiniformis TaxID=2881258 RepID=A0ABS8G2Z0_9FIRM|nr:NlpC/P60 family protein [Ruminococcus turbiniformis]MCC2255299.1 NlpC/P60 family protein [Ruminococcus turbiniformis]